MADELDVLLEKVDDSALRADLRAALPACLHPLAVQETARHGWQICSGCADTSRLAVGSRPLWKRLCSWQEK